MGSVFSHTPKAAHLPTQLPSGFPKNQGSRRNQFSRQAACCVEVSGRLGRGGVGSTAHPKGLDGGAQPRLWMLGLTQLRCGVTVTCAGDGLLHVTANPTALEGPGHVQGRDGLPVPHLSPP